MIGRRGLLAAAGLAPFAAHAAEAPEQREVEFLGVRDPQLGAQCAIADQYGLFREEGLTVNFRWMQSGGDVLTVMGSGAPLGIGGPFSQIVLAAQNIPVKIIAGLADISDSQGFVLSPGVTLRHPRELEGKRIAFTQGNSTVLLLSKLARIYGFDYDKVQLVNMNPSEAVVAASKGDVHGMLGWQPFLHRLIGMGGRLYATGGTLHVESQPKILPDDDKLLYAHACVLASQDWIATRPNTLRALLRGLIRANAMIATDLPRAMTAMQRVLRVDADSLQVMAAANKYAVDISPKLVAAYRFTNDWALGIRRIPAAQRPEDGISSAILAGTAPELVTWRAGT